MTPFRAITQLNHKLADLLQKLLVVIFAALVADVLWGVLSRYLLGGQASWSEELARLLMVWLALLGAALVCREQRHLGLDVVMRSLPPEAQRFGSLLGYAAILSFAAVVMTWGGWQLVSQRFSSGQTLPALGIAKAWFYVALPVSGGLISLFMLEAFWRQMISSDSDSEEEESEELS
ncbi:MAG: TRAP transporter small permease [Verrucomicrobiales bacterium]|nr:TRAP transporter small permease [Verrucomicrobiales bacterium]